MHEQDNKTKGGIRTKWHDSKQSGLFPNIAPIIEQQYREGPMYSYLLILGANTDSKVIYVKYYKHWKELLKIAICTQN